MITTILLSVAGGLIGFVLFIICRAVIKEIKIWWYINKSCKGRSCDGCPAKKECYED